MDGPEREQELWQRVAAKQQPDAKRRRGIREALERYYEAVGLLRTGRRHGRGDDPLSAVGRLDPIKRIE